MTCEILNNLVFVTLVVYVLTTKDVPVWVGMTIICYQYTKLKPVHSQMHDLSRHMDGVDGDDNQ